MNIYQITIIDNKGMAQTLRVGAKSLPDAIAAAQKKLGVTTEPLNTQSLGALDVTA